jgi:hypothetical protein
MGYVTKECVIGGRIAYEHLVVQALLAQYNLYKKPRYCNRNNWKTVWRSVFSVSQSIKFTLSSLTDALNSGEHGPMHASGPRGAESRIETIYTTQSGN